MDKPAILLRISAELPIGTALPPDYIVTGVRASRGESALFYSIPCNATGKRTQKSLVVSEFEKAYQALVGDGEFTLRWFKEHMPKSARQSTSCSFRVVGEVFVYFGLAKRVEEKRGHRYLLITQALQQ